MNMHLVYVSTIPILWTVFGVGVVSAIGAQPAQPTILRESLGSRLLRSGLGVAVMLLMVPPRLPGRFLSARFLPWHPINFWLGVTMVVLGLWLATYCRHLMGRSWSVAVQVKQSHELIRSGPYRFVRHPIYSGLLLALLGSALTIGQWRGLAGFMIAWIVLWSQTRLEERYMTSTFGENYVNYRRAVPAFVPSLRQVFHSA